MFLWYRFHAHQVIRGVFEDKSRSRPWRSPLIKPAKSLCFYSDPLRAAEPVHLDTQFRQRLFQNPGMSIRPYYSDRSVGNTTRKFFERGRLARLYVPAFRQIILQGVELLDVEFHESIGPEQGPVYNVDTSVDNVGTHDLTFPGRGP